MPITTAILRCDLRQRCGAYAAAEERLRRRLRRRCRHRCRRRCRRNRRHRGIGSARAGAGAGAAGDRRRCRRRWARRPGPGQGGCAGSRDLQWSARSRLSWRFRSSVIRQLPLSTSCALAHAGRSASVGSCSSRRIASREQGLLVVVACGQQASTATPATCRPPGSARNKRALVEEVAAQRLDDVEDAALGGARPARRQRHRLSATG